MIIAGIYPFNNGKEVLESSYAKELREIRQIIKAVDSTLYKNKISLEKTMRDKILYRPRSLNKAFKLGFEAKGWRNQRVPSEYSTKYYARKYKAPPLPTGAFRDMDFAKNRVGVEVQFGKYAFMVYNVCAKMTIFHNLGFIDVGVEIVPMKAFADDMSSGVSYFEQIAWDLDTRGVADIDIPVLILGVAE